MEGGTYSNAIKLLVSQAKERDLPDARVCVVVKLMRPLAGRCDCEPLN